MVVDRRTSMERNALGPRTTSLALAPQCSTITLVKGGVGGFSEAHWGANANANANNLNETGGRINLLVFTENLLENTEGVL